MKNISIVRCNDYQESLYFHWKQNQLSDAYHLPFIYEVTGLLHVGKFIQCAEAIFKSQYAFGLKFIESNNRHVIASYDNACIPKVKLSSLKGQSSTEIEESFKAYKAEFLSRPFSLNDGVTIYVDIVGSEEVNKYYLFVNCHHIISDVYSFYEILTRLSGYYNEENNNLPETVTASELKYQALNDYTMNMDIKANESVKLQLSQAETVDHFQVDYDREEKVAPVTLEVDAILKKKVDAFCTGNSISPFVFYLGCYHIFLHKVLQKEALLTGIPIANRPGKGFRDVVGYFVNTLPIPSRMTAETKLNDLFSTLKADTFNLIRYRNANVKRILQHNDASTVTSSSMYDNIFTYYKQELTFTLSGCKVAAIPVHRTSLHCPFTVIVEDGTDLTQVHFIKENRVLAELDVQAHFHSIINEVIKPATKTIGDINLVSDEDWKTMMLRSNVRPGFSVMLDQGDNLYSRFEKIAAKLPGRTACSFADESLTYEQLLKHVITLGRKIFQQSKDAENKNVALLVPVGIRQVVGLLSVLYAGKTYVPIDPGIPQERVEYILEDAAAALIVTTRDLATSLRLNKEKCIFVDTHYPASEEPGVIVRDKDKVAYIIYTSGTTGKPKGVMIPQKNVMALIDATSPLYQFNEEDKWSMLHSYAFDVSVYEIFGALLHGAELVIAADPVRKSHHAFWKFIHEKGITILSQTPSYFQQLIKEANAHPQTVALRKVIFAGEKLIFNCLKNWTKLYPLEQVNLINMYGITETTVHVTYYEITNDDIATGRSVIGKAIPSWSVCILGSDNKLLPPGSTGEICVTGEGVALGYLNKPALTAERFITLHIPGKGVSTIYKSGDLGRMNADGNLEYFGRRDKQVKIRGFRIELKEIEKAMQEHPHCDIAAVKLIQQGDEEKCLAAYYLSPGNCIPPQEMRALLKKKLPLYMIPSYLIPLTAIPLTVNGKINYDLLPLPDKKENTAENQILNTDNLELAMIKITQQILNTKDVNIEDNFFDLGGNSLLMIQFINHVNELLQNRKIDVQLQVLDIYQYSSIKDLLASIKENTAEHTMPENEEVSSGNAYHNRLKLITQLSR